MGRGDMITSIENGEDNFLGVIFSYDRLKEEKVKSVELRTKPLEEAKVGIGVIGAGNFAKTMLLPFLKKEKEVVFDTVATATGISAKDTASKFDFRKASTDYKQILDSKIVNTVMILTRHSSHAVFVTESLAAGKNVYVEKPLCVDIEDLPEIEQALTSSGRVLMVGYNRRFSPAIKKLKELIDGLCVPFSVHYRVNAGFIPRDHWYQQPENGGRIIGEGCHFVDTLQFLTGSHPVSVYATAVVSNDKSMPDQDNIIATIQFENGSVGTIEYVSDGDKNYPKEQIMVTGGRSNIFFDNFREIIHYRNGKKKKYGGFNGKGHKEEMKTFIQSIISGEMPIPWESLKVTSLSTQAIIDSQSSQKLITL
jgi:polar amino acid transport system substrate-binding protein